MRLYLVLTSKSVFHNSINFPSKLSGSLNWERSVSRPVFWFSRVGGNILKTILPGVLCTGYKAVLRKSASFVMRTLRSLAAVEKRWPFLTPLPAVKTLCPRALSHWHNLLLTFSSAKNFMVAFVVWKKSFSFDQLGGVFQCRADMGLFQGWKIFKNFINAFSGREHFQYLPNHDTGPFKGRFAMANFAIGNDVFTDLDLTHNVRISSPGRDVKIRTHLHL